MRMPNRTMDIQTQQTHTKLWMLRLPLQQPPIPLKQFHFPQRTHETTNNTKNITLQLTKHKQSIVNT